MHRDHGSMADSLAIWAFSQRYQIRVMVFQPPLPEIIETVQRRNRSLQAMNFVPTGQYARGQTIMILH
jgi:predicted ATPase